MDAPSIQPSVDYDRFHSIAELAPHMQTPVYRPPLLARWESGFGGSGAGAGNDGHGNNGRDANDNYGTRNSENYYIGNGGNDVGGGDNAGTIVGSQALFALLLSLAAAGFLGASREKQRAKQLQEATADPFDVEASGEGAPVPDVVFSFVGRPASGSVDGERDSGWDSVLDSTDDKEAPKSLASLSLDTGQDDVLDATDDKGVHPSPLSPSRRPSSAGSPSSSRVAAEEADRSLRSASPEAGDAALIHPIPHRPGSPYGEALPPEEALGEAPRVHAAALEGLTGAGFGDVDLAWLEADWNVGASSAQDSPLRSDALGIQTGGYGDKKGSPVRKWSPEGVAADIYNWEYYSKLPDRGGGRT